MIRKSQNRKNLSEDISVKATINEISYENSEQDAIAVNDIPTISAESSAADIEPIASMSTTITPEAVQDVRNIDNNGHVTLLYELYNESFPIKDGRLTHEEIDDVYNLTFVMPNCLIHLSSFNPQQRKEMIEINDGTLCFESFYMKEDPLGHYHGLLSNCSYYVYVEQEEEQLLRDQENMKSRLNDMRQQQVILAPGGGIMRNDGRGFESCSCIYGNPCVDEYGCRNWSNRFAIALKNGWKGF